MTFYLQISLVAYIIGVIFLALRYVLRKSTYRKYENIITVISVISFAYFFFSFALAVVTHDPIPSFNFLMPFLGSTGVGLTIYAALKGIKTEVKEALKETTPQPITYKEMSFDEAKKLIGEYLEHKKGNVWIEDVINDLRIDPSTVVKVIKDFHKKGIIKETS